MSPVFFVGKKDGSKRIVIDYRNLNDQTIKNNYLLLLITELIDNMGSKKVFTKMDLRWGFNNVRIKEGGIYDSYWLLRTNSDVFRNDKLASNISSNDERDSERPDK